LEIYASLNFLNYSSILASTSSSISSVNIPTGLSFHRLLNLEFYLFDKEADCEKKSGAEKVEYIYTRATRDYKMFSLSRFEGIYPAHGYIVWKGADI